MQSPLPKVLHPVAGQPMIYRIVQEVEKAGAQETRVVVGFGEALVRQVVEPLGAVCYRQLQQKGTADAVKSADVSNLDGYVVIMNGDHPLVTAEDIKEAVRIFDEQNADLAVVTAKLKNPGSFGRVVRYHGEIHSIVEAKDASSETLKINEINTGIYVVHADVLREALLEVSSGNAQKEFYLTDLVGIARGKGHKVIAIEGKKRVAMGVNTQQELAKATKLIFLRKAKRLLESGVIILDPEKTYIEDTVEIGAASVIYPGAFIKGKTKIGNFSVVETGCFLTHTKVGDSVQIKAGTYAEDSIIGDKSVVGPYAHLRPGSEISEECKIGNFVELKKVKMGKRSKASHLTYLGDAIIGEDTNIGCGTITCNYAIDHKKYVTRIGSNVFVGSDTQFVAPVEIGDGAIIASGSTITKNVPAGALGVARGKQHNIENYQPKTNTEPKSE